MKQSTIIYLGSSVTYGSAANGYSFADALQDAYGITAIKEAVSGTTLVDDSAQSYIARMKHLPTDLRPSAFVCQLSTNDASQKKPLGSIASGFDPVCFDTHSITGAIEYIIAYASATWQCPIWFYTGTRYDSPAYAAMVERLHEISRKWDIRIIDLWNDADMNAVSPEDYARYMHDPVHPFKAGYVEWWMPKFHNALRDSLTH